MPAPYILPQVQVFQEFTQIATEITNPLRAWIIAPNAQLFRYADATEKGQVNLGTYDPSQATAYSWPARPAGAVVDQDYVKVFIDSARLRYFQDLTGSDSTVAPVGGYKNRVRSDSVVFKTANGSVRDDVFCDRDVTVGDLVVLRSPDDSLTTYVRDILCEPVASSRGAATADAANAAALTASASAVQTLGDINRLHIVVDGSLFNGMVDGFLQDVYTARVTQGSVDGDLTTARFSLSTSSGVEFLTDLTPAALDATATVGARGLKLGWRLSDDSESLTDGVDPVDLLVGQTWEVTVQQTYFVPTATAAGTYTGTVDDTYVVVVSRGGKFADADSTKRPRISVHSVIGTDGSQNVNVTAISTAVAIGSYGVTISFAGASVTGLRKGDVWTVSVTAASQGRPSTLVLGHNLPTAMLSETDLDLELFIQKDIELPNYHETPTPDYNWTTSATQLTLLADAEAYDSSFTLDGVVQPLPVISGTIYAQYRAWLPTLINEIDGMSDISEIDAIPGQLHPDNPLKWLTHKALTNNGGTGLRYTAVSDPADLSAWANALDLGTERYDLYNLVLGSEDTTVLDLGVAHVQSMSGASSGKWRKLFVPLAADAVSVVVSAATSTDTEAVLGTITDNPEATGTQYTLLALTSGNASAVALGVQAGDLVRTGFAIDSVGRTTYSEYTVDSVVNEQTIVLAAGPVSPINTAQRIEIYHRNSATQLATQVGVKAARYGNRRVCAVYPDRLTSTALECCAALAGLASGVVPQQALTNVQVLGLDGGTAAATKFSAANLDLLASYGVWIVSKDSSGSVVTRDALTSDMSSLDYRSEMVVRNVDSISYYMRSGMLKYIGQSNVVPSALEQIRIELQGSIEFLKSNGFVNRLGGQLVDASIVQLRQDVIQKNKVVVVIDLTIPYSMDIVQIYLNA